MKRMMKRLLPVLMAIAPLTICAQKVYELKDISGKVQVNVIVNDKNVEYSVLHDNDVMVAPSPIFMKLTDGTAFGLNPKVKKISRRSVNETIYPPIYKKKSIKDQFNELTIDFKGGYSLVFRAYEDGAAYRFVSELKKPFMVESEQASFCFPNDPKVFVASPKGRMNEGKKDPFYSSFQNTYLETALSAWDKEQIAFLPVLVEGKNGKKICITEADLMNYPGMYVKHGEHGYSLDGIFAAYPKTIVDEVRGLKGVVKSREPYIARVEGNTAFPWRVMVIAKDDAELLCNDMVYKLATPAQFTDFSWIKPGKVAWDWWNTCNLTGVDFKAGMNTPTYKAFIDFAADNNLEYIIIDDGWSGNESLLKDLNPDIDLKELVAYGNQKGVGIILWASWRNSAKDTEAAFSHYAQMGIKGFKIDFFDRDDQPLVQSVERIVACAAEHRLVLDLHGLKPYGIQRTYPNVLNFEGVKGLENAKWEPIVNGAPLHNFPRYDVTAPYLRMLIGPMDYTPGATMNATRETFRAVNDHPMSQGTRVHQMAMYTLFEAPLQMLADSPSKYMKEQECTDFIAKVPTVFDETVALDGEVGEYLTLARRKGDVWYIASMTDWTPRDCTIDLSFLGEGSYEAEIFSDGINADREATDYKKEVRTVTSGDKLNIHMAPGGGWTARIWKR